MNKLKEVSIILKKLDKMERLDILHFLRIEHSKELISTSREFQKKYSQKLKHILDSGGVYLLLIVDPEGNVILYPGKTSGKSPTSGLRFRLNSHTRFLGKTPCTLFIPNWWIKRVYPIPLNDNDECRKLEHDLWGYVKQQCEKQVVYGTLADLDFDLSNIINEYLPVQAGLKYIELNPELDPLKKFRIKVPPAGDPKRK